MILRCHENVRSLPIFSRNQTLCNTKTHFKIRIIHTCTAVCDAMRAQYLAFLKAHLADEFLDINTSISFFSQTSMYLYTKHRHIGKLEKENAKPFKINSFCTRFCTIRPGPPYTLLLAYSNA